MWLEDHDSLSLTRIEFNFLKEIRKVRVQGLSYGNSNTWGWHNSLQSGVIGISDQLNSSEYN